MTDTPTTTDPDISQRLARIEHTLNEIQQVVREAAPLLNSRPVRALRGSARVSDYLRRGGGDG